MSFVFAPAAKNIPNLQNVFTSMTLSMNPTPYPYMSADFFGLGFSIHCETTVPGDFAKVSKYCTWRKTIFPFRLRINVKQKS